ncbi:Protein CBG10068 [Caenorhabditis briggsae]|uniref:Protein CBG10068 n=1 Tax=Caenorhabditis briggsae TaxID=6238 RepID=A8XAB0_CAEBR|nr:Protein CBG10068 [Caenorhabditis briggsae]CAP29578.1 Protein CBG10068 [Caenorhabditis briggsae]
MASDMRHTSSNTRRPSMGSNSKLLAGKSFLLDIGNRQWRTKVAERILNYGANIMDSFGEVDPHAVVSDNPMALKFEKKDGSQHFNEKIRTPQSFLKQMDAFANKKGNTTSATTSLSTIRPRTDLKATKDTLTRTETPVVPQRSSKSRQSSVPRTAKVFVRVEAPTKRPEIRCIPRTAYDTLYGGSDTGHSVFRIAETALKERRVREYDLFVKGRYEPHKKPFKMDEKDKFCQFCEKEYSGERKDHERTDEHRAKARTRGLLPALERGILSARLKLKNSQNQVMMVAKRKLDDNAFQEQSKRARVEFEYGENMVKADWQSLKENNLTTVIPEKILKVSPGKGSVLSPRRRQQRIQPRTSQGDLI